MQTNFDNDKTTIKFSLNGDVRRVRLENVSFSGLLTVVRNLYKLNSSPIVKYLEDENDLCTVSSDAELVEALTLASSSKILRLQLFVKEDDQQPQTTCSEVDNQAGGFYAWKGKGCGRKYQTTSSEVDNQAGGYRAWKGKGCGRKYQTTSSEVDNQTGGFHAWKGKGCGKFQTTSSEVDNQTGGFYAWKGKGCGKFQQKKCEYLRLCQEGIALMDSKNFNQALECFQNQLALVVNRGTHFQKNPLYNIACCYALLGEIDSALSYLSKAIYAGFTDVEHIENDEDLVILRDRETYTLLLLEAARQAHDVKPGWRRKHELFAQARDELDKNNYGKAREIIQSTLELSKNEKQQRIAFYLLACCESLLGNVDAAIDLIEKVVALGFKRVNDLKENKYLDNLRETERFQNIISSMQSKWNEEGKCNEAQVFGTRPCAGFRGCRGRFRKEKFVAEEQKVEQVPKEENQTQVSPQVENTPVPTPVPNKYEEQNQLLSDMGFADAARNVQVLDRVGGELGLAISALLG